MQATALLVQTVLQNARWTCVSIRGVPCMGYQCVSTHKCSRCMCVHVLYASVHTCIYSHDSEATHELLQPDSSHFRVRVPRQRGVAREEVEGNPAHTPPLSAHAVVYLCIHLSVFPYTHPGRTRPARPRRCFAAAADTATSSSEDINRCASYLPWKCMTSRRVVLHEHRTISFGRRKCPTAPP